DPDIDERVVSLYAGREMIARYSQVRAENQLARDWATSLENEKNESDRIRRSLKDKLEQALKGGQGIFRGVTRDAAQLGRTLPEMFGHIYEWALPEIYPKLDMGTRALDKGDAEAVLKAANLQSLNQVFYGEGQGLNLIIKEGTRYVPNKEAPIAKEILD